MRELTSHKVNEANEKLTVMVTDKPGAGNACHRYEISGFNADTNPSAHGMNIVGAVVLFQNGPINEVGVNGVTQEALLAIIEDRLVGFQSGPYACTENAKALEHVRAAQEVLQSRTKARMARGVEGTHAV